MNFKLTKLFSPDLTDNYRIQKPLRLDWKMHTALVNLHINKNIKEKYDTLERVTRTILLVRKPYIS